MQLKSILSATLPKYFTCISLNLGCWHLFFKQMTDCFHKIQIVNDKEDAFHQLMDRGQEWVVFVKFYFYDPKTTDLKISEGTGFLNSKWSFVTAAHNLYLLPEKTKCNHCVIYVRDPNKNNRQITIKSRPQAQWFQSAEFDLALIRLEQEVKHFKGKVYYGDIADFKKRSIQQLYVVGYTTKFQRHKSISGMQMYKIKCQFQNMNEDRNELMYSGKTQKGFSGSPIVYRQEDKDGVKLRVFGLHLMRKEGACSCKGLLFTESMINTIQCWMSKMELGKMKIQKRFQMMMKYFATIFESIKRQVFDNDSLHEESEWFGEKQAIKEQQYRLQAMPWQQALCKKREQLANFMIYGEPQEEIRHKIEEIYILQNRQIIDRDVSQQSIMYNLYNKNSLKSDHSSIVLQTKQERQYQLNQHFFDLPKKQRTSADNSAGKQMSKSNWTKDQSNINKSQLNNLPKIISFQQQKPINLTVNKQMQEQSEMQSSFNLYELSAQENITSINGGPSNGKKATPSINILDQSELASSILKLHHEPLSIQNIDQSQIISQTQKDVFMDKEIVDNQKQEGTEIGYTNLSFFPHNCIGWIVCRNDQGHQIHCGSGFLISNNLVLTSAHIFMREKDNGVQSLIPAFFTLIGDKTETGSWKRVKVRDYRMNRQFQDCQETITDYYKQKRDISNQTWNRQLLQVKERQLRYSFALLQLDEPVLRGQYFEAVGDPNPFQVLNVCGFTKNENRFYQINQKTRIQMPIKSSEECIYYTVNTRPCQSGSPIFIRNKDSVILVGIHVTLSAEYEGNMGVYITDRIISVMQQWASEMHSPLVINDPKNIIKQLHKVLQEINRKYNELKVQNQVMVYDGQKQQQALQSAQSCYLNILAERDELSLQFEKNKVEIQKLQKAKKQQEDIIYQLETKIFQLQTNIYEQNRINQQLQISLSTLQRNLADLRKRSQMGSPKSQKIKDISLVKSSNSYSKEQEVSIQIIGIRYSEIAKKLKATTNKAKITTLAIDNQCSNVLMQMQTSFKAVQVRGYSGVSINVFSVTNELSRRYILYHQDVGLHQSRVFHWRCRCKFSISQYSLRSIDYDAKQIPDMLRECTGLRQIKFSFRHILCKAEIFDRLVEVLNSLKLQKIEVCIHADYQKYEKYDWTKCLQGSVKTSYLTRL